MKRRLQAREDHGLRATTLGELSDRAAGVFCWCNRCGHHATIETAYLTARLGPRFPVPEVGVHMRCSGCGAKDVATRPAWPTAGHVASHTPNPRHPQEVDEKNSK